MISKMRLTQVLSLIIIACLLSLAACTTAEQATAPIPNTGENTPTPMVVYITQEAEINNSSFTMLDGTELNMVPLTQLQVLVQPLSAADTAGTVFSLAEGQVVIVPPSDSTSIYTVQTASGLTASLQGCAMAVAYSSADDSFELYCIGGECKFGATNGAVIEAGKYMVYRNSIVETLANIDAAAFKEKFNMDLPVCAPVPVTGEEATATPVPVNNAAATATAACISFNQRFPSTPCP